jgi:hypothetical protein
VIETMAAFLRFTRRACAAAYLLATATLAGCASPARTDFASDMDRRIAAGAANQVVSESVLEDDTEAVHRAVAALLSTPTAASVAAQCDDQNGTLATAAQTSTEMDHGLSERPGRALLLPFEAGSLVHTDRSTLDARFLPPIVRTKAKLLEPSSSASALSRTESRSNLEVCAADEGKKRGGNSAYALASPLRGDEESSSDQTSGGKSGASASSAAPPDAPPIGASAQVRFEDAPNETPKRSVRRAPASFPPQSEFPERNSTPTLQPWSGRLTPPPAFEDAPTGMPTRSARSAPASFPPQSEAPERASTPTLQPWSGRLTPPPASVRQSRPAPSAEASRQDVTKAHEDTTDPELVQVACKGCGGGLLGQPHHNYRPPSDPCGCGGNCVPGREPCPWHPECETCIGRIAAGVYDCICCPDPCYEPRWIGAATASFFADSARPVTETRLRADWGTNLNFPDRAEYFMARENATTALSTGGPCARPSTPKGLSFAERRTDYRDFRYYQEVASGKFSAFVETPYRRVNNEIGPCDYSGFADLEAGTKSLLLDCEILQLALQMRTFVPVGVPGKGLGTGHVSIEPSLLWSLHIAPETYLQAQTAYWIPINGDQVYAGDMFHYHVSLNQVLCRPYADLELIGTFEISGWAFLDGAYTDPDHGAPDPANPQVMVPTTQSARGHLFSAGGGIRLVFCSRLDVGFGSSFAITDDHLAEQLYRLEIRWRY